jgi:hypothetical protein
MAVGDIMETVRSYVVHALPCALIIILSAGCASPRSFAELAADAEAVPVPAGVTFVRQSQSVNNGPGFTTAKFEEVSRQYSTKSDTAGKAGGLMSGAASKAVTLVVPFTQSAGSASVLEAPLLIVGLLGANVGLHLLQVEAYR